MIICALHIRLGNKDPPADRPAFKELHFSYCRSLIIRSADQLVPKMWTFFTIFILLSVLTIPFLSTSIFCLCFVITLTLAVIQCHPWIGGFYLCCSSAHTGTILATRLLFSSICSRLVTSLILEFLQTHWMWSDFTFHSKINRFDLPDQTPSFAVHMLTLSNNEA